MAAAALPSPPTTTMVDEKPEVDACAEDAEEVEAWASGDGSRRKERVADLVAEIIQD